MAQVPFEAPWLAAFEAVLGRCDDPRDGRALAFYYSGGKKSFDAASAAAACRASMKVSDSAGVRTAVFQAGAEPK